MRAGVRTALATAALAAGLLAVRPVDAQVRSLEYEVKAAFLLNFLGFTDWPPGAFARPEDPIRLCIASPDPFGPIIDNLLRTERINGRPVAVQRLGGDEPAQPCTMLFVSDRSPASRWISRAAAHTLTVGESPGFLKQGGMIALVVDSGRVRFDVNLDAVSAADIRINPRVLRLARSTISSRTR